MKSKSKSRSQKQSRRYHRGEVSQGTSSNCVQSRRPTRTQRKTKLHYPLKNALTTKRDWDFRCKTSHAVLLISHPRVYTHFQPLRKPKISTLKSCRQCWLLLMIPIRPKRSSERLQRPSLTVTRQSQQDSSKRDSEMMRLQSNLLEKSCWRLITTHLLHSLILLRQRRLNTPNWIRILINHGNYSRSLVMLNGVGISAARSLIQSFMATTTASANWRTSSSWKERMIRQLRS